MGNINYSVYGNPEDWTHWQNATPQSGTQGTLWGQQRIGASEWTDNDFNDYPYFMFGKETIYRNYKDNGYIDINAPLDNSIAYSAIANSELPQQNVMIFDYQHNTLTNPFAKTKSIEPTPFALSWYYYGTSHISNPAYQGGLYGFDGFPNDAMVFGSQGMQRVAPYAEWDSAFTNTWGLYNPNLRIAPVVKFGVKSVILEINVVYKTTGDYPTDISNLKTYLNHTPEWLQEHKVIAAYCKPYYRTNKNGTYTSTNAATATDRFGGCSALFFRPYKCGSYDIYNYTAYLSSDLNISGNLPIYGRPITDSSYTAVDVYGFHNYENPTQTDMNSYACLFGTNRGDFVKTVSSGQISCHMELDLSDSDNVEYIMKGAAAYGLFFCKAIEDLGNSGRDTGDNERWLDTDMYCGVIAPNGLTYGDYTHGTGNKDNQVYSWTDSTQTPFIPSEISNNYSNATKWTLPGEISTFTRRYVLNDNAVKAMKGDLFNILSDLTVNQTDWSDLTAKAIDGFLVQNPIDCIVSLKKYPLKNIPNDDTLQNIQYGRYASGNAAAKGCTMDYGAYIFEPTTIKPQFGNSFLDYEPFTSAELYIPYCGTIQLKMCDIINKTLTPVLVIDFHTGQCTGYLMSGDIVIETIDGTAAIDIPVTGIQTATIEGQLQNAANNARAARINKTTGMLKSGLLIAGATVVNPVAGAVATASQIKGYANSVLQNAQTEYELTHTEAPTHIIGSSSSGCGWCIDGNTARLILYYPSGDVLTNTNPPEFNNAAIKAFGKRQGFATVETGILSDYSGFTVADVITDGINATDTEKDMIKTALANGVYL